jgi:hypothetical protein
VTEAGRPIFFKYLFLAWHFVSFAVRKDFVSEAIRCHGASKWHLTMDRVAKFFGILDEPTSARTGGARLSYELRYVPNSVSVSIIVYFDTYYSICLHVCVDNMCVRSHQ